MELEMAGKWHTFVAPALVRREHVAVRRQNSKIGLSCGQSHRNTLTATISASEGRGRI